MTDDHEQSQKGHSGPQHSAPYPVSRLAPSFSLVEMARDIEEADRLVNATVSAKLQVIADQIRALQEEARAALAKARQDQELHHAHCTFQRRPGQIYHLYAKLDGRRYLSMLSPAEWHNAPPHRHLGSYRLENDLSWTQVGQASD